MKIWLKAVLRLKRVLTSFIPKPICDIILSISAGDRAIALSPVERDIDPGIVTRRWILRKRKHDVLRKYWTYFKPRATCLRDVRTHLGRLLVIMYSWLACPGLR